MASCAGGLALTTMQIDDPFSFLRACQFICILGDMSLSAIKIGKIKFKPNDVSHFYAFVGREGAAGGRP